MTMSVSATKLPTQSDKLSRPDCCPEIPEITGVRARGLEGAAAPQTRANLPTPSDTVTNSAHKWRLLEMTVGRRAEKP